MKRFRLSPEARQDLREITAYIARDNDQAAQRVRRAIQDSCGQLAQCPHIGHRRDELTADEGVLFWPVYSYLIVYRPGTKPLDVLRVLHGKRDVKTILE